MDKQKDSKEKWKNILHNIRAKFNYVMVLFYLIFSLILLLTSMFSATLSPVQRYTVGGILLVYAIFRAYRIYQTNNEIIEDDE